MKLGTKKKTAAPVQKRTEKKAKRKARGGGGKMLANAKRFFADHAEKLLLGMIALVSLTLVYKGFRRDAMTNTPESVKAAIDSARRQISSSTWTEVKQTRFPEPDRFDQQATEDVIKIDPSAYALNVPFHAPMQERRKRRTDPELLAAFQLEVKAGFGALAVKVDQQGETSRLASQLSADDPALREIPSEMQFGRGEGASGEKFEGVMFVALTGLVPYQKQFAIYEEALKNAAEYSPERDVPTYVGLYIERAEVGPNGQLSPWTKLDIKKLTLEQYKKWEGRAEERADPTHLIRPLIMDLPPLFGRDVSQWAVHSTVPLDLSEVSGRRVESRYSEADEAAESEEGPDWQIQSGDGGGRVERREGVPGRVEARAEEESSVDRVEPLLKVENGMLRYLDFTVEPGKAYAYRVQLVLDDPNNPSEGTRPSNGSCETEVIVRRQESSKPVRESGWSEPSPPIVVSGGQSVLAISVEQPKLIEVGKGQRIRLPRSAADEPEAKVMALVWDPTGAYEVPSITTAVDGAWS